MREANLKCVTIFQVLSYFINSSGQNLGGTFKGPSSFNLCTFRHYLTWCGALQQSWAKSAWPALRSLHCSWESGKSLFSGKLLIALAVRVSSLLQQILCAMEPMHFPQILPCIVRLYYSCLLYNTRQCVLSCYHHVPQDACYIFSLPAAHGVGLQATRGLAWAGMKLLGLLAISYFINYLTVSHNHAIMFEFMLHQDPLNTPTSSYCHAHTCCRPFPTLSLPMKKQSCLTVSSCNGYTTWLLFALSTSTGRVARTLVLSRR